MNWMLLPFRRYAEFSGRSRRREYWMFVLLNLLISAGVGLVFLASYLVGMTQSQMDTLAVPVLGLTTLYSLAAFIPGLALTIRRLHDTDRSGWNIFWGAVPLVGPFIVLFFYITDGTAGANRFGADPKGRAA